jgi:hypothetical protein
MRISCKLFIRKYYPIFQQSVKFLLIEKRHTVIILHDNAAELCKLFI